MRRCSDTCIWRIGDQQNVVDSHSSDLTRLNASNAQLQLGDLTKVKASSALVGVSLVQRGSCENVRSNEHLDRLASCDNGLERMCRSVRV